MGASGHSGPHKGWIEEIADTELRLDIAIFEDSLCVGPDNSGWFETLTDDLEQQRNTAQETASALRNGASQGQRLCRRTSVLHTCQLAIVNHSWKLRCKRRLVEPYLLIDAGAGVAVTYGNVALLNSSRMRYSANTRTDPARASASHV